jgi:flagellar biosynthesis/type III secretory pathway protein FliH|tara:strand:+ start:167 stop:511 length:345 start_codon:yes stop_codon:yes gene_type:complete
MFKQISIVWDELPLHIQEWYRDLPDEDVDYIDNVIEQLMQARHDEILEQGKDLGFSDGYDEGFKEGKIEGDSDGYERGLEDKSASEYDDGWTEGYKTGYDEGHRDGIQFEKEDC